MSVHDHDQVDGPDQPEPDVFHDEEERPLVEDDELEAVVEFASECWKAGVDPDEVAVYLKGC